MDKLLIVLYPKHRGKPRDGRLLTFNCKVEDFGILAKDKELDLIFIYELLAQPFIKTRKRIWGTCKLSTKFAKVIVPEESASLIGFKKSAMNATHTQMNEFNDVNDPNYQRVSVHILDVVKRAPGTLARRSKEVARGEPFLSIPHLRLKTFVGREELLSQIEDRMAWDDDKYQARVALCGQAGVGKTQLAVEYAYRTPEKHTLSGIYWVSGASSGKFRESYLRIGRKAKITTDDSNGNLDIIKEWLEDHQNGRWLMIVDNVDDLDLLQDDVSRAQCEDLDNESERSLLVKYIPNCSHGSILYTSRDRSACIDLAGPRSWVQVDQLSANDCQLLVENSLQACQYEDGGIDDLTSALEGLPLALAHALSYIEKNGISINEYMDLFHKSDLSRIRLLSGGSGGHASQTILRSVAATTWMISFNQIKRKQPLAAKLLGFMSIVDRHCILTDVLPLPQDVMERLEDPTSAGTMEIDVKEAFGMLEGFSMITRHKAGSGHTGFYWTMHALVHLSMHRWLQENGEYYYHITSVLRELVSSTFTGDPVSHGCYLSSAFTVLNHLANIGNDISTTKEVTGRDDNLPTNRLVVQKQCKLSAADALAEIHLLKAIAAHCEAKLELWVAESWLDAALIKSRRAFGQAEDATLSLMCDLSSIYLSQSRGADGLRLQLEVFESLKQRGRDSNLGDKLVVNTFKQLALAYKSVGQHTESEKIWNMLVKAAKESLLSDRVELLLAEANLASCYLDLGRLLESGRLFDKISEQWIVEVPPTLISLDSPIALNIGLSMADCYFAQGKWDEACTLYDKVGGLSQKSLGQHHPITTKGIRGLASVHLQKGNLSDAEEFLYEVCSGTIIVYGRRHIKYLEAELERSSVLETLGYWRKAANAKQSVVKYGKDILAPDIFESTSYSLAKLLVKSWEPDKARAAMRQYIEMRSERLGKDDPDVLAATKELAGWTNLPSHFGLDEDAYRMLHLMHQVCCT